MSQGRPAKSDRSPFGQRLFNFREAAGLTQLQVAEELDIGQRSYSAWERGNVAIRPDQLKKLAILLGVSVGELVGERFKKPTEPKGKLQKVFDEATKLPRRKQQKIANVIEALIIQDAL